MDTLLILRDTITTNVVKIVGSCQPSIQEAETNWQDIAIVGIVCFVVALCIGIISFTFYKWQENKYCYQYKSNEQKYQYELKKANGDRNNNANKSKEDSVDLFLAFCEDRKDIRENKSFVDYCVEKYKTLKDRQLDSKEDDSNV